MLDRFRLSVGLLFVLSCAALCGPPATLPETPKKPVEDEYHGVKVIDPYRWLEDRKDPDVQKWVTQQNRFTRGYLDKLPQRKAILDRLQELTEVEVHHYEKMSCHDGKLFAKTSAGLATLKSANDPDSHKILVDPAAVLKKPSAVVDFYEVSPDKKKVAVSMSFEGKDVGSVYVFDVASGKKLPDVVPNVRSPIGGDMVWKADSSGFYYTRNPPDDPGPDGEPLPQLIYFHPLGKDAKKDPYVFGKTLSSAGTSNLNRSEDGKYLLIMTSIGWAPEHNQPYLLEIATGKIRPIGTTSDKILLVHFGKKDELFVLSNRHAPRGQILSVSRDTLDLKKARVIVPQGPKVLETFMVLENGVLMAAESHGTASRLCLYDASGKELGVVPVPKEAHVSELVSLNKEEILFLAESFFTPPAWFRFKLGDDAAHKTRLDLTHRMVDFSACEMVHEDAVSKDGTKVPMTILRRKDIKLDGTNPVLLTGYGGYNLIQNAEFDPCRLFWLEKGGVIVIAHLRGDGNFGEEWFRAGTVTQRQNAFDDFAGCAKHLIARKYTRPEKLAIEGGSNGGTLMGAALTQHPGLFRAVVAHSGVYDMLRQELQARGVDVQEFGTVKDKDQFKALHAYSPYHKVVDGTRYPAVLLTAGENDGRVDATDTWRFAARLQAAGSKRPILLWTRTDAGHQGDSIEGRADAFAFLCEQLEVAFKVAPPGKKMPAP
jgi:prolyl oligopeptidase